MARKTWRPFQPTYTPGTYTRIGVASLSDEELAREYSRVRREAQERLRSFQRSRDPELREAAVVAEKAGVYLNRAQIRQAGGGRAMMEDLLIDAYRFVSAKTSSVSGFRATQDKQINALQAAGYDFVDRSNLRQFGEFMDYFRSRKDSKSFGSETVATAFNQAQKQKISPEELKRHFKFYAQQIKGGADTITRAKSETRRGRR
jgi:predicted DNA-binding WGR domain protein